MIYSLVILGPRFIWVAICMNGVRAAKTGDMMMIYSVRVYLLPSYEHDVMVVLCDYETDQMGFYFNCNNI